MKLPTKEQILKASDDCPDAKCVLQELFPQAFEKPREEWEDITEELKWRTEYVTPYYYLGGYYGGDRIVNVDIQGAWIPDFPGNKDFKVEIDVRDFRILRRKQ